MHLSHGRPLGLGAQEAAEAFEPLPGRTARQYPGEVGGPDDRHVKGGSMTTATTASLRQRPAFRALAGHYDEIAPIHLRELFAADPERGARLTAEAPGLYLDYSKNRVTDETLRLLLDLAAETGVADRSDAMFAGERINLTENRAVLHVA